MRIVGDAAGAEVTVGSSRYWAIFESVRYFLTGRLPEPAAILLVESGSRGLLEKVLPGLRATWGGAVRIDIVSCFATLPAGFDSASTRVYRVSDYRGRMQRRALYALLRANGYSHLGIVCSGEPLMTKWKWSLALRIPAKVFIINENADYFWLDRLHLGPIRNFALFRAGLAGAGAVRTLAQVAAFPFTVLYLMGYAALVHGRRALRGGISQ